MTSAAAQSTDGRRIASRAIGNVLLGLAIGLMAYYSLTDVESGLAQRSIRVELDRLGPISVATPQVEASGEEPVFDFEGWAQQDRAFWTQADTGDVVGRLVIDDMALDVAVVKGTDRQSLKRGPGWITTTSVPGPAGNCAISGHRTTYLAPFRRMAQLKPGDVIDLYTPFRRYRYEVTRSFSVRPWQVEVIAPTAEPILTLTACHPPYSARYRLIVQSKLVDARRLKDAPASTGKN